MNISDAAKKSELPVKTIRYYADIGLVKETGCPIDEDSRFRVLGELFRFIIKHQVIR